MSATTIENFTRHFFAKMGKRSFHRALGVFLSARTHQEDVFRLFLIAEDRNKLEDVLDFFDRRLGPPLSDGDNQYNLDLSNALLELFEDPRINLCPGPSLVLA